MNMLDSYLKRTYELANRGDAREESYYSILEELLKEYSESVGKGKIKVTTLPKKTEAGNPDFRVWDGKQHIVGYIEAKGPTVDSLGQVEDSAQLNRYRYTFPNLILTNFFEFRLYRNGQLIDKVQIARPWVVHKLKTVPVVEKETEFFKLLESFFAFSLPKVYNAKTLAIELAKRTRFLKDEVVAEELKEAEKGRGFILGFYEAFRKYLISGLTKEDFANLYSQTITYGLFAARTRAQNGFNLIASLPMTAFYKKKKPNINKYIIELLTKSYKEKPSPEQIFYYIYAVLYSNIYRSKYAEFLKIDFPRVPFTQDHKLFLQMGRHGEKLVDLHLLKSPQLDPPLAKFQGQGNNKVDKLKYDEKTGRVYINVEQYFENVNAEIWQYQIGGYQVCHKWLKDRKGRTLSLEEIKHYCKMVTALEKTIATQKEIDDIYLKVEKGIIEL